VSFPSSNVSASNAEALRRIKAVAMDVDGVLTDGTFLWGAEGGESKRFCFADSTGIANARAAGVYVALVSGDSTPGGMALVRRYADRLGIVDVFAGCQDKAAALLDFAERHGLRPADACFIGDDTIDLGALAIAGLAAAPADAHPQVLAKATYVTAAKGGQGAVREVLDLILGQRDTIG
jgi:3-deoxy-D-manno-octulosonate 8-phosphate phosphatase (KDO 8-P phosphatase)